MDGECDDNGIKEISNEDDCMEMPKRTIKNREAAEIFNKALEWPESEMVEQRDLNVLRQLQEKVVLKVLVEKNRLF